MNIKYHTKISDDLRKVIDDIHGEYERENGVDIGYEEFAFSVEDECGKTIGALTGSLAFNEIYIDEICVSKDMRGRGIGKKLIQAVEEKFDNGKYDNINLVTNKFQAPEFYSRCGFEVEFVRENRINPNVSKYYMVKKLRLD